MAMNQKEIVIKWRIKGYTKGFNLNGKFISDKNLKPLLFISTKKIHCPF